MCLYGGDVRRLTLALLLVCSPGAADSQPTAERGRTILQDQNCTKCHSIAGAGGSAVSADALSRPLAREYSPAGLTATLWNHAPKMWDAMAASNTPVPKLSPQDAGDVFAYFASLRYFEPMGDAGRGWKVMRAKKCDGCHASDSGGRARAVSKWQTASDPVALVSAMWNPIPHMREDKAKRGIRWPELTARELSDIVLYARSFPAARNQPIHMELPPLEGGGALIGRWGCQTCHTGANEFGPGMANLSLTEVAAEMWNHGPKMMQDPSTIPPEEMRKLLGAVWARQFVKPAGDPARGRKVAESKKCLTCHEGGAAPEFSKLKGRFSVLDLTSALWAHGPNMRKQMNEKKIDWPRMSAADVSNLIAYIDTGSSAGTRAAR